MLSLLMLVAAAPAPNPKVSSSTKQMVDYLNSKGPMTFRFPNGRVYKDVKIQLLSSEKRGGDYFIVWGKADANRHKLLDNSRSIMDGATREEDEAWNGVVLCIRCKNEAEAKKK